METSHWLQFLDAMARGCFALSSICVSCHSVQVRFRWQVLAQSGDWAERFRVFEEEKRADEANFIIRHHGELRDSAFSSFFKIWKKSSWSFGKSWSFGPAQLVSWSLAWGDHGNSCLGHRPQRLENEIGEDDLLLFKEGWKMASLHWCILLWAFAIGALHWSHGRFCDVGKFSMNKFECSRISAGRESPSLQMILALQVGTSEVIFFWSLFLKRDGNDPKRGVTGDWGDDFMLPNATKLGSRC